MAMANATHQEGIANAIVTGIKNYFALNGYNPYGSGTGSADGTDLPDNGVSPDDMVTTEPTKPEEEQTEAESTETSEEPTETELPPETDSSEETLPTFEENTETAPPPEETTSPFEETTFDPNSLLDNFWGTEFG